MPSKLLFYSIRPPPGLLSVLGTLEWYMTPTLDAVLLCSSRAGSDLGRMLDWLRSFVNSDTHFGRVISQSMDKQWVR